MRRALILGCALVLTNHAVASAQFVGTEAADRARLAEITGKPIVAPGAPLTTSDTTIWRPVGEALFTWNSRIPYSLNDGAMWAGRGVNLTLTGGATVMHRFGTFDVAATLAPTYSYSQNSPFDIIQARIDERSGYSSPFHADGRYGSADLPLRFGSKPWRTIDLGESSLIIRHGMVAFGATNAHTWWGPAIRNTLVLSNNAAGFPRIFLSTAQPVRTRIGTLSGEFTAGTLVESPFFDSIPSNDRQAFDAIRVTYSPPGNDHLTFGFARAVYVPQSTKFLLFKSMVNPFIWRPKSTSTSTIRADQVASFFGRWVFPESGLELYGEFARNEVPRSVKDFFETPFSAGGFTFGLQWAFANSGDRVWRLQSEVSALDQNQTWPGEPTPDFYTGLAAVKGYTQRGQILGAAIGPGGSSEWIALDRFLPASRIGVFVGRVRWEDDAHTRELYATWSSHDVSVMSGIRGGLRTKPADVSVDLTLQRRFNFLFQNGYAAPLRQGTVIADNVTLTARITARNDKQ